MKRVKTWKRWDLALKICKPTGPFRLFAKRLGKDEDAYIVMQQADYLKMKAVYDAAMKWDKDAGLDGSASLNAIWRQACAKAAKP